MWYPQKLVIKNLMSYRISGYEFVNGKAVMVHGINDFNEEQESNGSGKSAVLEGVALCLLGSPLRDASAKDLIREGEDSCEVEFVLHNTKLDRSLVIWRKFYGNTSSAELKITVDDKPVKDMVSVRHGNEIILDTIGISREDLLNYYILSNEKYVPLLKMSDTKKKEMIGRFSQADLINPAMDALDESIDELGNIRLEREKELATSTTKLEVYQEELSKIGVADLKRRRQDEIDALELSVLGFGEAVLSADLEMQTAKKSQTEAELDLANFEEVNFVARFDELDGAATAYEIELRALRGDQNKALTLKSKIEKILMDTIECPKCSHEFTLTGSISPQKARGIEPRVEVELVRIDKSISEINSSMTTKVVKAKEALKSQENEQIKAIRSLNSVVDSTKFDYMTKKRAYEDSKRSQEQAKDRLDNLLNSPLEDRSEEFKKKINGLNFVVADIGAKIDGIDIRKAEAEEERAMLMKFKTHLSNKAIGALEASANTYLRKTRTDLSIQLDGYKETRGGKIRENISATIFRDGESKGGLGKFSGGEKVRVEIALIMAPQKLINMNTPSGGLDLLFLDEVIESVDSAGIGGVMHSLNDTGQTILVITHGTFDQSYPHVVTVTKGADGISEISSL